MELPFSPHYLTNILIIGTAFVWITYDVWVEWMYGHSYTISDTMRTWGYEMPWLLIVWGALCWHFWGETASTYKQVIQEIIKK
jgi:hypothetical protein